MPYERFRSTFLVLKTSFPSTSAKISDVARIWLGCGSDVAQMWLGRVFGCRSDAFSDVAEKVWQKLRERGFQQYGPPTSVLAVDPGGEGISRLDLATVHGSRGSAERIWLNVLVWSGEFLLELPANFSVKFSGEFFSLVSETTTKGQNRFIIFHTF